MRESSCSDKCICTSVVFVMKFNKRLNFADKRIVPIVTVLPKSVVSASRLLQYYSITVLQFSVLFSGVEFCSFFCLIIKGLFLLT